MKDSARGARRFVELALARIAAEPVLDRAIHSAKFLGEVLWKNATGYYQLADLERALIDRVEPELPVLAVTHLCRYGHILTKAYDTGGHTRVVERLVQSCALQDSAVVVVDSAASAAHKRLCVALHGCKVVSTKAHSLARISAMVAEFVRFEVLILYVHPYDIESVIAAGVAQRRTGVRVLLFNHADHVFSYGYGVAERVLEISHFGWALRNVRETLDRSLFVGIPLSLPAERVARMVSSGRQRGPVIAAGTAYKFRPALGWSFPRFVRSICRKLSCRVDVLGPNRWRDWWWWPVFCSLNVRLAIHARLEHERYLAFISHAAAYVDSFPIVGGTAFAEVMGQGVPCFGVLTGSHGYSPADLVKSPSVEALISDIVEYYTTGIRPSVNESDVYELVRDVHDAENVASRIAGALGQDSIGIAPPWRFQKEIDIGYFEKIWATNLLPSMPVHVLPPLRLLLPFLLIKGFWCD